MASVIKCASCIVTRASFLRGDLACCNAQRAARVTASREHGTSQPNSLADISLLRAMPPGGQMGAVARNVISCGLRVLIKDVHTNVRNCLRVLHDS